MMRIFDRRQEGGTLSTPATCRFLADVLRGLRAPTKELPSLYFYDEPGSELFERITRLPEYYLTRTEQAIIERHAAEIAAACGTRCLLIEFGSGSSTKTRRLLDHLQEPAGYVPIDVSGTFLDRSAHALASEYPEVEVLPMCADFTTVLELPVPRQHPDRRVVFFPGSTVGNSTPEQAIHLLRHAARLVGPKGGMILGVDLQKDPAMLEAAYNDSAGVTAAFNRNILVRINRELGADFDVNQFTHRAFYHRLKGRIEMHLVSRRSQWVHIADAEFFFEAGESIRTEYSYKYSLAGLEALAGAAGFRCQTVWTDERRYFGVHFLEVS